jgi:hypothetical protein
VPATARCRNDGNAAIPSIATPPLFRKYRREMVIAVLPFTENAALRL